MEQNREELTYRDWERSVYSEDIIDVKRAISDTIDQCTPEFRAEFRVQHPRKGTRWLLSIGRVQCSPDGSLTRLSGINLDITELKDMEAALRDREHALRPAVQQPMADTHAQFALGLGDGVTELDALADHPILEVLALCMQFARQLLLKTGDCVRGKAETG